MSTSSSADHSVTARLRPAYDQRKVAAETLYNRANAGRIRATSFRSPNKTCANNHIFLHRDLLPAHRRLGSDKQRDDPIAGKIRCRRLGTAIRLRDRARGDGSGDVAMALLGSGDRVNDRLVVDRLLGEGAYSEVHRARHEYLGWQAIKVFKKVASAEEIYTMLGEARLLSTLGHPNIVRVFDAGTVATADGLRGFFTMEYIAGGSLERLAQTYGPAIPTDLVVDVLEQIAAGLAMAHTQNPPIVHRDLIPANVLVGYDEAGMRIRVSDFGLAKRTEPGTRLASAQGTIAFTAPEVLRNEGYSCASDVWSVGTIGYWLLTNHLPFTIEQTSSFRLTARFDQPPLAPGKYNDDVDPELDRIILATLETDPRNRPASAQQLLDALRARRDDTTRLSTARTPAATDRQPSEHAQRLADAALALYRAPGQLSNAADLMEEAINLSPQLRDRHLYRLTLWRRGVTM